MQGDGGIGRLGCAGLGRPDLQAEGGQGFVGGVGALVCILLLRINGVSVRRLEPATRPLARDRYEFFARPPVPPEVTMASM